MNNRSTGGTAQCSRRNYDALCDFFGKEQIETFVLSHSGKFSIMVRLRRKIDLFCGRYYGLSAQKEKKIFNLLNDKQWVFIDTSKYGRLAKLIKISHPQIRIISFFHNFESEWIKSAEDVPFLYRFLYKKVLYYNEKCACLFSDATIALTQRDANGIQSLYAHTVKKIIPISLPDKEIIPTQESVSAMPTGLFVGYNCFANVHGIEWFVKNVLPFVNMKLQIIGNGMDRLKLPASKKIEIFGYVPDLQKYMDNADFMILPIFLGAGMKVKTCEALLYGKNIIGTQEAFIGYQLDCLQVGALCETAEDFINAINEFPGKFKKKYNPYARSVYSEHYSDKEIFCQFASLLQELKEYA
jgi:hypothetical protein